MSTCYIVEIFFDNEVRYAGAKGVIRQIPKFFIGGPRVQRMLDGYRLKSLADKIRVTQISYLERGIKQSNAKVFGYDEFMKATFTKATSVIPNNPNAIYKIKLDPMSARAKANGKLFVSPLGLRKEKFGKSWNRAGDLRSHIQSRLSWLRSDYMNAEVLEIEMAEDGFTPKVVKTYNITDFYCATPACRKNYDHQFPNNKYNPIPELP